MNAKVAKTYLKAHDPVVEANRQMLLQRSQVGIAKYGTTLAGSGLTQRQFLQHALEETLDLANYLQAAIMEIDKANENGKESATA